MKGTGLILSLLIFLSFLYMFPLSSGASSAGMHVEGPTVVAMNTTVQYKVYINGDFDMYKCTLLIGGQNLSGAEPLSEVLKTSYDGYFTFDVTTPNATQTIYLDFRGYGLVNSTHKVKVFERKLAVEVKKSYTIVANVKNVENYTITNVTVNFYIDGRYIGNTTVDKIGANSTKQVKYIWVPDVGDGEHVLEMRLIEKGVMFENNKVSYSRTIYIGNPPNYDWVGYLGIATLITLASLFTFMLMGKKHGKRENAPKWKK